LSDNAELMPITYELRGVETLLTSEYFPNDPDIDNKEYNFFFFLSEEYCQGIPNRAPPNPRGFWTPQPDMPSPSRRWRR
jgi:hypothetical protein